MAERPSSYHQGQYPEVAPQLSASHNIYNSSYEYYEERRSPAPEYLDYRRSPQLSSVSPPVPSSDVTRSPPLSDSGWRAQTFSPNLQYSEYTSPQPERVYGPTGPYLGAGKQYYEKDGVSAGTSSVLTDAAPSPTSRTKKPFYKRRLCIIIGFVLVALVAIVVACGVVFGSKKSKPDPSTSSPRPSTSPTTPSSIPTRTGDPDLAVGGDLNPAWYSTSGAFNGSGIAVAGADPGSVPTIYTFYQTYQGDIAWRFMKADGTFASMPGNINDGGAKPLNGTPLSIVNHKLVDNIIYHVFYIDEDYQVVERVLQTSYTQTLSAAAFWDDGYLTQKKLKTNNDTSIGLQACYWNNFYGLWSPNDTTSSIGIQLFYADSDSSFQQWSWLNGTESWNYNKTWTGLDGHAGVGCETYDTWMFEYMFFVDLDQNIAMYWKDNNISAQSTPTHPTLQWNKIANVDISDVQKASSLGYTTYMIYQGEDATIRGANISWAAENTTIATTSAGHADIFQVDDLATGDPLEAIRGSHLSITALETASGGADLYIFFQEIGDEYVMYTRDMKNVGGQWQRAKNVIG